MDAPVYTVTVDSLDRGWAFTATHTVDVDDTYTPPTAPVILADPLTYSWAFDDEVIPNPLTPSVVKFSLWSFNGRVRPLVRRGDFVRLVVRLGGPAGTVLTYLWLRVSEVDVELVPDADYSYRATVTGTDLLVDLGGFFPGPRSPAVHGGVRGTGNRLAWAGVAGGYSVAAPAGFVASLATGLRVAWLSGKSARELFRQLLAGLVPTTGRHHVVSPYVGAANPAGYANPGVAVPGPGGEVVGDPGSAIKFMIQPASRTLGADYGLPLRFANAGGRLVLTGPPSTQAQRLAVVSAGVCTVPANARQGREHAPNSVRMTGVDTNLNGVPTDPANLETDSTLLVQSPDISTGYRGRELDTLTPFREYGDDPATASAPGAAVLAMAGTYLADPSTLASDWTFDGIVINVNDMTAADAEALLPVLTPAYLDAGRDNQLVRHLTVHSLDPDVRVESDNSTLAGFIVSGQLSIAGGRMTYTVTTTPGQPTAGTAASPITVGEFTGASYVAGLTVTNVHPNITVADLDLVDL